MRDAELLERARGDGAIVRRRPAEQVAVRGAAHQHHALDGEGEGRHVHLRHVGDHPGAFTDRDAGKRAAADRHLARLGAEDAGAKS